MARNEQLIRQHRVLQILERVRFGKTLEELRDDILEELGLPSLHVRTLRRDIEALQIAGFDIVQGEYPDRGKVWKLGPKYKESHRVNATATELIALSLGRDLLLPLAGTPYGIGIESFWSKIRDDLPAGVASHFENYRKTLRVIGVPFKNYDKHQGIIKTLNRGIDEHRLVEAVYHSVGKAPRSRVIEPLETVLYQSSLYIIAAAHEDPNPETRIREFKLDRFSRADLLDRRFTPPQPAELEQYIGHSFGVSIGDDPQTLRIHIRGYAARLVVEEPWHPEQKVEPQPDGSVILSIRSVNLRETLTQVLSLGPEAEVLAPPAARDECRRMLAAALGHYEAKPSALPRPHKTMAAKSRIR